MKFVIDNIEQFKVYFDVVYEVTDIIELQLFPEKMVCSTLDKSKTRFFNVEYKKEFFSVYENDGVASVTIFVDDLFKVLKSANKTDTLIVDINDTHLICKLEAKTGNFRIFEFVLPNDYTDTPHPPHLETPAVVDVDINDIKQSINDLTIIGTDLYCFNIKNGSMNIISGTTSAGNYTSVVDVDVDESVSASSMFSLEYIKQLMKFDKISKIVKLQIGTDYPLGYRFEDEIMGVTVFGMVAPRMSEE